MSSFVSHRGVWHPAKEKIGLTNKSDQPFEYNGEMIQPGDPFVYSGPDRQALKELADEGVECFGKDFKNDPEFLQMVRNMGFNDVDSYFKVIGYDEKKDDEDFKKKADTFKAHEIKERVKAIKVMAGGRASTKEASLVGGFGNQQMKSAAEA